MRLVDLILFVRNFHAEDLGGPEQTIRVIAQAEDRRTCSGPIAADAFEYAETVMKRVGQDVGVRLAPGHELPVVPDEAVAVRH